MHEKAKYVCPVIIPDAQPVAIPRKFNFSYTNSVTHKFFIFMAMYTAGQKPRYAT